MIYNQLVIEGDGSMDDTRYMDGLNRDLAEYGRYRDVALFEDTPGTIALLDEDEPPRIPWSLMTPQQKSDEMERSARLAYRKQHGKDPSQPI